MTEDPIVDNVIDQFITRSAEGMETYGQSMRDNPMSNRQWLGELKTELMDAILYAERLGEEMDKGHRFIPPQRRTSYNEDLVVSDEFGNEAFRFILSWSVDVETGKPFEFFVVHSGKPGLLQDALDEVGRRVSRIMQGRYDEETT
jgi:hypothetical protein